ncbi:MAG: hypothetical protein GC193_06340 [Cryomorphaceae bacterium]|nr:hypothetical protein [Cryomorphaceae bacterium]
MASGSYSRLNFHVHAIWFNAILAAYLLFKLLSAFWVFPSIVQFYLADFFALPIILGISEDAMRFLYGIHFRLNRRMLMLSFLYAALMFEWVFPYLGYEMVSDPWDVAAYAVGLLFFVSTKKTASKKTVS